MRAAVLVLALSALATASSDVDEVLGAMDIKQRQVVILKLLNQVTEPVMYKEIQDIGMNFKLEENIALFTKSEVVKRLIGLVRVGPLPRGEIFTLHVPRQMEEVISMFHVLYYAKDFTTFVKAACWMRLNLNEGMFVYALTIAVRHRPDCRGIILPPPYEIYPYFFVRGDVIQKSYLLKMKKGLLDYKLCDHYGIKKTDKDIYIVDENIYDSRVFLNIEDKLRYFTEDIDLNTYYYYFHVDYPFWMNDEVINKVNKVRRFELTVYMYQQILARYNLERLSNELPEVQPLSLRKPIEKGYWPWLMLHNGIEMPVRLNNLVVATEDNVDNLLLVETYESMIKEAIIKGYVTIDGVQLELTKPNDIETLGRLIYSNMNTLGRDVMNPNTMVYESYRYLLIIMKSVLGLNTLIPDRLFVTTTVLDHYETALRDPIFYQLQKRLLDIVLLYKLRLPSYTKEELGFPGVKIDNVVVDKLVTHFDDYFMDVTNVVTLTEEELKKAASDMKLMVRKRRLNHQPFKVSIDVVSDKTTDCVIRIFLGPKFDSLGRMIDINKNRLNFVEIDSFLYKLMTGKNTIVRNSADMHNLVRDRIMTHDIWKKIETITDYKDVMVKDLRNFHTGYPSRLLLPKGRIGGMEFLLYVIVSPLKMIDNIDVNVLDINRKDLGVDFRSTVLLDKMPLGYPFDRPIVPVMFFTSNMKFVDVMIFHKKQVSDMKTRWERWVLRDYMLERTPVNTDTYFVDTDVNMKVINQDMNLVDLL
ncbi:basic juvenile hormone-suppressible protein 2-like [Galleria mellonella]|uniref:Basic juvenile hormone-suppressible protein 2-like n=1 Tax=Galleria mellonella TaxID=7137 RepID=A0A6J1WMG8_GALME|nr:basic juvenile hormone-suppressible protein 2-like [Galleria mellonella]